MKITDTLNLMQPQSKLTATAKYFKERPLTPDDGNESFRFEHVSPFSNTYRRLFGNIQGIDSSVSIRTDSQCEFEVHGFVLLPNGKLYEILQVEQDNQVASRQAMRLMAVPIGTEYVLRLIQIDNPWEIV